MYKPLNPSVQSVGDITHQRLESIELNRYSPPSGPPPDSSKHRDSKANFTQHAHPPSTVKHWPMHSQQVATLTPLRTFIIVFDAILASAPIMFIALAIIAARLDGRDVSSYGLHLHQTLLLSPTIFPVIFAALMGRCFKYVGLYRAERGISLGRLEQLVGCQSLFSALERQTALRSWSILGLLLTLIWLLSPLGGQSALRLLDQETKFVKSTVTINYLNPTSMGDSFLMGASALNTGRATFTSVFLAALLSSSKYQATPMDLWGNVKVPAYSSLNASSSDWKDIDYSHNVTYASLIGIPVSGVQNGDTTSNYSMKARQWDITCSSNKEVSDSSANFGNATATWKLNYTEGRCKSYPCKFNLKSIDRTSNFTVAECQMTYQYLETRIGCNGTSCQTNSMRKLDLLGDAYTQEADDFTRSNMITNGMSTLPTIDNHGVASVIARGSTNMEKWMYDPWDFIGATYDNVDLWKLSPELLGERLTIIWNTFWQSTYATTALGGNLPKNLTSLSENLGSPNLGFNATQAALTTASTTIYKTNWRWFVALLVSSIILQIAAYAGLILKYITLAPDIIGYASSLTLLNPYIPTPTGGTTLHGLERAALLHDLQIRIGDVCAGEPVGAIAVAKADARVARLDRRRWYI
ncbi:uncharacterized protein BDR25DRAFT_335386 [Lindgomyces ingoldianus]|uniref:Uncharacterized protein n=1 Tax=Lindgomyces ingoldianus TaxID=673940 RepID=A0ACB6QPQ2_9PLEO|nr:uncharacterized protein BDR25DRAFT_335386 [Lindgomyces ingoldianus]KAF2468548.1 hypothetical protein BDR25DRAFT_335386 [Lindgomyces ingoldianus]